jgi:NADPH2:quinone reductase
MKLEDVPLSEPGIGQALVRLDAVGVNFIDINQRSGAYQVPLPYTPGSEGAGVVEAVGEGADAQVGQRVVFAQVPGAYAEAVVAPADLLVPIPDGLSSDVAAAVMLQGMTAHYLLNSVCELRPGDRCVIHSAAGGVGLLFIQMAKLKDIHVIGLTSSPEKAKRAREAGADNVLLYSDGDFAEAVGELTQGSGVRAVFDAVGKDTFDGSLRCLGARGHMVLFGQASGPVPPVDPWQLWQKSLFLTRPVLHHYVATREELLWRAGEVLELVAAGRLDVHIHARYPLADASEAHRAIAGRATTGKVLLIP